MGHIGQKCQEVWESRIKQYEEKRLLCSIAKGEHHRRVVNRNRESEVVKEGEEEETEAEEEEV